MLLKMKPATKDYLWGGEKLIHEFHKESTVQPLAETWEASTHPDGLSFIADGPLCGRSLRDVLSEYPEMLGTAFANMNELPILVKLIDAAKDLSVQVHPDDAYAARTENGQRGKTEMWYVLEAEPGATLVYGLAESLTKEQFCSLATAGKLESYLTKIPVHPGDVFLIEPGTVHAIGAGIVLAEIQESSNLTYRIYDYNRLGPDGRKRPLHLEKAAEVAELCPKVYHGLLSQGDVLVDCAYFTVRKRDTRENTVSVSKERFKILLVIAGEGFLDAEREHVRCQKGDCFFASAEDADYLLSGSLELLEISAK